MSVELLTGYIVSKHLLFRDGTCFGASIARGYIETYGEIYVPYILG